MRRTQQARTTWSRCSGARLQAHRVRHISIDEIGEETARPRPTSEEAPSRVSWPSLPRPWMRNRPSPIGGSVIDVPTTGTPRPDQSPWDESMGVPIG